MSVEQINGDSPNAVDIDAEALHRKYREERDKRLRKDGAEQYIRPTDEADEFGEYVRDPHAAAPQARLPRTDDVDVVVIGAGLGGLMTGCRLRELGVANFQIIEKGSDFGGTWYWNRYPGIACDVESYIYMPRLEELRTIPTERYASGPEILRHCTNIARHFDLYSNAIFQTQVTELSWDESCGRWIVSTDRGDRLRARFVAVSTGPLNQPKLPGLPGLQNFKGRSFHTSRWDYDYTGGNAHGNLTKLSDKRIGIIGTGSTGVQCIPHLAQWAKYLYIFQRTPSAVHPRFNRPTDSNWAESLKPGWQIARVENFTAALMGLPVEDLVQDGWTKNFREILKHSNLPPEEAAAAMETADFRQMEKVRKRIGEIVRDPATAEALRPYYNQFCKRLCFSDQYLPAFNRPNVSLVDTNGKGVECINETGVIANGKAYEVDCLIFATGFEWYAEHKIGSGFETYGRDGVAQSQAWADGMLSLYGAFSRDFPNRFILGNAQLPHTANFSHTLDVITRHIAGVVKHCLDNNIRSVEPTADAQEKWVDTVVAMSETRRAYNEACTPGYYNSEGQYSLRAARNAPYPCSLIDFGNMLDAQRAAGNFEGLELTPM